VEEEEDHKVLVQVPEDQVEEDHLQVQVILELQILVVEAEVHKDVLKRQVEMVGLELC
jgi:hypothetical protein